MDLLKEFLDNGRESGALSSATVEMYKVDIEDFKKFIEDIDFVDVKEEDILRYIEFLKKRYQDNSIFRKYSSIRNFYKYLLKNHIIDDLPMENISIAKSHEKVQEYLEWGEIKSISDFCENNAKGKRDRLIIKIIGETGVQISEVLDIKISDLNRNDFQYFSIIKNGGIFLVELSEEISEEIKRFIEDNRKELLDGPSDYLFYGLSRQNFRARFMSAAKKAGIQREISPNMIRNTFQKEKERYEDPDGDGMKLLERIKQEYMRIGIGDD